MPRMVRKPCSQAGCSELTPRGGPCDTHKRQRERIRNERGASAYRTTRWQRIRKAFLYNHPWCAMCARQATVADHHPISRRDLVARGEANPDAERHLRPLCKRCHDKETARLQPGGFVADGAKPVIKLWTPDT